MIPLLKNVLSRSAVYVVQHHAENFQRYDTAGSGAFPQTLLAKKAEAQALLRLVRKSLVISKLSQLLAMLGATFNRFGTMPLYSPATPSCATITRIASHIDLYWYPIPVIVLI